ncbi:DUF6069 family protein [Ruania halotolerans]|uniref:DUF6069 family protein n=1 Tax=Ruania halotolerans TaxID=2897773 RepID=UPI001E3CB833|nr:DUF6069 family protein [Ruania halotolerans]UFU05781.1 DUF6069 family protein [Ruania halotolerans]
MTAISVDSTTPTQTNRRAQLLTVIATPLLAAVVWILAVPIAGVELVAQPGGQQSSAITISIASVLAAGLTAALLGWAAWAVLDRLSGHARSIWRVLAVVVLAGSMVSPVTAADGAASVVLIALHLVVGATLIVGLPVRPRRVA